MTNKRFINDVLSHIICPKVMAQTIREDLMKEIENRLVYDMGDDPFELLGHPKEVAKKYVEKYHLKLSTAYDYKSRLELFGLPLVHITGKTNIVAKGIFAVGLSSMGIFSFGVFSLGLFSFGVMSFGLLLAVGSLAFSLGFSIGAIAIAGIMSLGAIAISSQASIGAIAIGKFAIGDIALGKYAFYDTQGSGDMAMSIINQKKEILAVIESELSNPILLKFLKNIINSL